MERTSYTESEYERVLKYIERNGINYKAIKEIEEYIKNIRGIKKKDGKKISESTIKMYLVATHWYLKKNKENEKNQMRLKKEIEEIAENTKKEVKEHKLLGTQKANYVEWSKIMELYGNIKKGYNKSKTSHTNYVLLSCYVLIPPRRLKEYALMHVIDAITTIDNNLNYYVKKDKYFLFNNYKTQKKYKTQRIDIPIELSEIINEYIEKYKITGSLFNLSRKAIQLRLKRLFERGLSRSISVNILRHSFISDGKESGKFLGEEENYASKMGHSVITQLDYYKSSKKM